MNLNEFQRKFLKNNEEAIGLLARAEQDYIAGRLLILETMLGPGFCLIEQSIEKYLKAWLCLKGKTYPKIHNLNKLFEKIIQIDTTVPEQNWFNLFKRLEERWNAKYDEKYRPMEPISTLDLDIIDETIFNIRIKLPLPSEIFDSLLITKLCNEIDFNPLWHHHSDVLFKQNRFFYRK